MLVTIDEIVTALGGTGKAAEVACVLPQAISNWKFRERIPSDQYFRIKDALQALGKEPPLPSLFGPSVTPKKPARPDPQASESAA